MESGEGGASRRLWPGLLLWLLAGCATDRPHIDRALLDKKDATAPNTSAAEGYLVSCPDALSVAVDGRPEYTGRRDIGPDGRIDLGTLGRLRVEGRTTAEIAQVIARAAAEVPASSVHVSVIEYESQQIYMIGQVAGLQRAVVYQGPETVLDLLRRAGGITRGAEPDSVYVVRAHVAEGRAPEVFRVDLRAILFRNDPRTNIRVQPLDQVYVGETAPFSFEKCVAPWLRPLYEAVCGMRPRQGKG